jgi:hypothetical protein
MNVCLLPGCESETPSFRHLYCCKNHANKAYLLRNAERVKQLSFEWNITRTARRRAATGRANSTRREREATAQPSGYIERIRAKVDPATHRYKSGV